MSVMSRLLVMSVLMLATSAVTDTARAGGEGFGASILGCFHPDAEFTSASYVKGSGRHAWMGWIKFRESRAMSARSRGEVVMSFSIDTKTESGGNSFYRVMPFMDDGSLPPAPGCYLREWQEKWW